MVNVYANATLAYGTDTNIRLIELLTCPSENTSESNNISCKFHVLPLDSAPIYTAISYMWGQDSETSDITLDGQKFAVKKNLSELLEVLSREESGLFWIDAICIDQESIRERNHQVGFMGKIYSQATNVLVWLGCAHEAITEALEKMKHSQNESEKVDKAHDYGDGAESTPTEGQSLVDQLTALELDLRRFRTTDTRRVGNTEGLNELPPTGSLMHRQTRVEPQPRDAPTHGQILNKFLTLCKDPYWSRAWIVQESVLARDVKIRSGNAQVDIQGLTHQLQDVRSWLKSRKITNASRIVAAILNSPAAKLLAKRSKWQDSHGRSYLNPWDSGFGILGCSDVRDRVYAMAALMDPKIAIVPDYNKTPSDVFKDIFEQHLKRSGAFSGTVWNLQAMLELNDGDPVVQRAKQFGSFEWAPLGTLAISSRTSPTTPFPQ